MITTIVKKKEEKQKQLLQLEERYIREKRALQQEIQHLQNELDLFSTGADLHRVSHALKILSFSHGFKRIERSVVMDAIADIANDCPKLKEMYFAIKDYQSFRGQRSDCRYGYGPKHGRIVFSIGLKNRQQPLTDVDKDACIYLLLRLLNDKKFAEFLKGGAYA